MKVLGDEGVSASFFVPAMAMKRYPDEILELIARGHEVALHGLGHERPWTMSESKERADFYEACEIFESVTGFRPRGFRAPSFDPSPVTLSLLEELEFVYDSSLMSDDDPYELRTNGTPLRVMEIPVEWTRDDATYLLMDRWSPMRPTLSTSELVGTWRSDWHRAAAEGGLFQLTLHPDIIGHRSRIEILSALVSEIRSQGSSWFATHEAVALHCNEKGPNGTA